MMANTQNSAEAKIMAEVHEAMISHIQLRLTQMGLSARSGKIARRFPKPIQS